MRLKYQRPGCLACYRSRRNRRESGVKVEPQLRHVSRPFSHHRPTPAENASGRVNKSARLARRRIALRVCQHPARLRHGDTPGISFWGPDLTLPSAWDRISGWSPAVTSLARLTLSGYKHYPLSERGSSIARMVTAWSGLSSRKCGRYLRRLPTNGWVSLNLPPCLSSHTLLRIR
jgi:hypothetical protein